MNTNLIKMAKETVPVKFYDDNGKFLLERTFEVVLVPQIIDIEPPYMILDEP